MEAKKALLLFSVMLALATAAAIGVILPDNYPTPEPIAPQQTVPAAPQAPVPAAPQPGHPGGIYTQITATLYGPIEVNSSGFSDVSSGDIIGFYNHTAPDNLSAYCSFTADTRDTVEVNISIDDDRDTNGLIYITVAAPAGVEVGLTKRDTNDTLHHVSPGVYVGKVNSSVGGDDDLDLNITVYGQPIASGDRIISMTFTAQ